MRNPLILVLAMNRNSPFVLFLSLFISIGIISDVHGQDPRFSQFNSNPQGLNPAMTGVFDGKYRVTANYRDQWSSVLGSEPFRTIAFGAETKIEVNRDDFFGVGFTVLRDEVGVAKFNQTKAHLSGSFFKRLSGGRNRAAHYVGLGAQVGGGQNSLDWSNLWFSRQFNEATQTVDTGLDSGEIINTKSNFYLDLNAGILWYMIKGDNAFYAGGSMSHINAPEISLIEESRETLFSRYTAQIGAQFSMNRYLDFLPAAVLLLQGPSQEIVLGSSISYDGGDVDEIALRFGMFIRSANRLEMGSHIDAIIATASFELSGIQLGLSYDVNVSSLNLATNSRGAFELSFGYIAELSINRRQMINPKF